MTDKLAALISTLRASFANVESMSDASYKKLCAILDTADNDALRAAYEAKIKFVSPLALNRMIRRGLIPREPMPNIVEG